MSYFNYDPFFDDENDDKNEKKEEKIETTSFNPNFEDPFQIDNNQNIQNVTPVNGSIDTSSRTGDDNQSGLKEDNALTTTPKMFDDNSVPPIYENKESPSSPFLDGNGYGDYGNGGGNMPPHNSYSYNEPKRKKQRGLGVILAIMIPILLITNVLTSLFVFNYVWTDAKTQYTQEINNIIEKESHNSSLDGSSVNLIAYKVAKTQMNSVLEIYASFNGGSSAGTGFVVTDSGYILTNAHVVTYTAKKQTGVGPNAVITTETKVAPTIYVQFADNATQYTVTVISYDSELDIAVLKFDNTPSNLKPVEFADSTVLSYGEPCVAIGNAQGYGLAVTEGVVNNPMQYFNLSRGETASIQHSAEINPGNSGGPLFNMYGQVVGINSFKLVNDNSEVATDAMGFAIPSAVVKDYVNGLGLDGLYLSYTATPEIQLNN